MNHEIISHLEEMEQRVKDGRLSTFSIKMNEKGMIIQPEGEPEHGVVLLEQDLLQTLHIFFYDVDVITYLSNDYTTLKSLMNAHACLARMSHKKR